MQSRTEVVVRIKASNERHHLFNNNGTYWLHYTRHNADYTKERIRESLHTSDLPTALQRRDERLRGLLNGEDGDDNGGGALHAPPSCGMTMTLDIFARSEI